MKFALILLTLFLIGCNDVGTLPPPPPEDFVSDGSVLLRQSIVSTLERPHLITHYPNQTVVVNVETPDVGGASGFGLALGMFVATGISMNYGNHYGTVVNKSSYAYLRKKFSELNVAPTLHLKLEEQLAI